MSEHLLTINNKEVFEFYTKHSLNFERMNIIFVDILKQIISTTDNSFNNNIASQLFDKITSVEHSVLQCQASISSLLQTTFHDSRREYLNDIKLIITSNTTEHITPLIRETTSNMIDKTSILINDILPKSQEGLIKDISSNFKLLQSSVLSETSKLISSSSLDRKSIDDFLTNINSNMTHTHNILSSLVSTSEQRIEQKLTTSDAKINDLKSMFITNNQSNTALQQNVKDILKKFEKGSGKGNISEHILNNILLGLFPSATIDHVGNEIKETGDIMLTRINKPTILIENKDHTSCNVPKQDIDKFIRDCEIQNCCGIMFAQNRGIVNKRNFEIQLHNGNVLLYVHEVNFDPEKIQLSIELVEQFKLKLDELNVSKEDCNIDVATLEEINKECQMYVSQKQTMLKLLKDFTDKMNMSITELKMPTLEKYLSCYFATSANQSNNTCKYCNKIVAKSLLQHYRYCPAKKDIDVTEDGTMDANSVISNTPTIQKLAKIRKTKEDKHDKKTADK